MFFSICIPTYNRGSTIIRALNSIKTQDFEDLEILVIDDGSIDNTELLVNKFILESNMDVKYFRKCNGGKHSALNLGIENANGEFFIILDSDDYFTKGALYKIYKECLKIRNDERYSGIMGKTANHAGDVIGNNFPEDYYISSYVDFHFFSGLKYGPFGDCCECNKTKIIKKYRFPEDSRIKFIPEAYIFDQIGVKYNLLCTNDVYVCKEYRSDGISKNKNYKNENICGFLYHYISRIENVFPNVKDIPIKLKIIAWWRYWTAVKRDIYEEGPRVKHVDALGRLVYIITPIINLVFKVFYKQIYFNGR